VDACRHVVRDARTVVSLARRPVLFALARALGEAWPGDVARGTLVTRDPGKRTVTASRAARVESRLRLRCGRQRAERDQARVCAGARAHAIGVGAAGRSAQRARCSRLADGNRGRAPPWRGDASQRTGSGALISAAAADKVQSWTRAGAPVDDPARAGFHDNLVTPGSAAERLRSGIISRATAPQTRCAPSPVGRGVG
jgi:hypothetical protein